MHAVLHLEVLHNESRERLAQTRWISLQTFCTELPRGRAHVVCAACVLTSVVAFANERVHVQQPACPARSLARAASVHALVKF